jgi:hypothetical protein
VGLSGCGLSTTLDMVRETVAGRRESSGYPLSAERIATPRFPSKVFQSSDRTM